MRAVTLTAAPKQGRQSSVTSKCPQRGRADKAPQSGRGFRPLHAHLTPSPHLVTVKHGLGCVFIYNKGICRHTRFNRLGVKATMTSRYDSKTCFSAGIVKGGAELPHQKPDEAFFHPGLRNQQKVVDIYFLKSYNNSVGKEFKSRGTSRVFYWDHRRPYFRIPNAGPEALIKRR